MAAADAAAIIYIEGGVVSHQGLLSLYSSRHHETNNRYNIHSATARSMDYYNNDDVDTRFPHEDAPGERSMDHMRDAHHRLLLRRMQRDRWSYLYSSLCIFRVCVSKIEKKKSPSVIKSIAVWDGQAHRKEESIINRTFLSFQYDVASFLLYFLNKFFFLFLMT